MNKKINYGDLSTILAIAVWPFGFLLNKLSVSSLVILWTLIIIAGLSIVSAFISFLIHEEKRLLAVIGLTLGLIDLFMYRLLYELIMYPL